MNYAWKFTDEKLNKMHLCGISGFISNEIFDWG